MVASEKSAEEIYLGRYETGHQIKAQSKILEHRKGLFIIIQRIKIVFQG